MSTATLDRPDTKNEPMLVLDCPCGKRYQVPASKKRRSARCAGCGSILTVGRRPAPAARRKGAAAVRRRASGSPPAKPRGARRNRPRTNPRNRNHPSLVLLSAVGGFTALLLSLVIGWVIFSGNEASDHASPNAPERTPTEAREESDLIASYRFASAARRAKGTDADNLRRLATLHDQLIARLSERVGFGEPCRFDLPAHGPVDLAEVNRDGLSVRTGDRVHDLEWSDLPPETVLELMALTDLQTDAHPDVFLFADRFGLPHPKARAFDEKPARRDLPVLEDSPAVELREDLDIPKAPPAEHPAPAVDVKAVERDLARAAFAARVSQLERLRYAYRFQETVTTAEAYVGELRSLGLLELADQVDRIASTARKEQRLLERLENAGTIEVHDELSIGRRDFEVARVSSTRGGLSIEFAAGGAMEVRWASAPTLLVADLIGRLPLPVEERLHLAEFLLDRGFDTDALATLALCGRQARATNGAIDALVARARGIDIPASGFVLDRQRGFLTPLEQELFDLGLVRWQDQWITAADRKRLRKGYSLESGCWLPKDHLDQLRAAAQPGEDAFVRVDGEWTYKYQKTIDGELYYSFDGTYLPADRVRELRSDWETAWVLTSEDFVLRTDVSEELLDEIVSALEAAWPGYVERYGNRPPAALEYYAFADFDDFRAYCEANDLLEEMQGAQGFIDHKNQRAVAFLGRDANHFLRTSIHELAHLYYCKTFPDAFPASWYAEGEATWFEGIDRHGDRYELHGLPSSEAGLIALLTRQNRLLDMDVVLQNTSSISIKRGYGPIWYASAWSLVSFLDAQDPNDPLHEVWLEFRDGVATGRITHYRGQIRPAGNSSFEELLRLRGLDPARVEKDWHRWLNDRASQWSRVENTSLFEAGTRTRGSSNENRQLDRVTEDEGILFRGQHTTLEEIKKFLSGETGPSGPAIPEDNGIDLVRRRTRQNTHPFDADGVLVSLPENPAWTIVPLGSSSFGLGRGVFRIEKGDAVRIDAVAIPRNGAWLSGSVEIRGDDPAGLAQFLSVYLGGDSGETKTDMGRFRRQLWARRVVELSDGQRLLVAVRRDGKGRDTLVVVISFAAGFDPELPIGVDSILDSIHVSKR